MGGSRGGKNRRKGREGKERAGRKVGGIAKNKKKNAMMSWVLPGRARQRPKIPLIFHFVQTMQRGKPKMPMRVYFFLLSVYLFTCSGDSACLFTFFECVCIACVSVFWLADGFSMACFSFLPWRGEGKERQQGEGKSKSGMRKEMRIARRGLDFLSPITVFYSIFRSFPLYVLYYRPIANP